MKVSSLLQSNLKTSSGKQTEKPAINKPSGINEQQRLMGNSRAEKDLAILDLRLKTDQVKYEKLVEKMVFREEIQFVWNKIYKSASYFGDFGQRYSPEWASALGVTDPEKILELEKLIDIATELFIADFTETVAREI